MAEVKMADVAKLRKMTGAGMMDCKKALEEANCDFDKAVELIRERGKAIANKRADREASEGVVLAMTDASKKRGALIVLNCETDFVAKNKDFLELAHSILEESLKHNIADLESLKAMKMGDKTAEALVLERSGVTGEKMELSYYKPLEAEELTVYIHPGNKMASILGVNKTGADSEVLENLAMQVAGMNPVAVDADSVPEEVKKREFEIGREQARLEGKPDQILDKIAEGRLQKFLKESTLMAQFCIWDNKLSIEKYISDHDKELKVTGFDRYSLQD